MHIEVQNINMFPKFITYSKRQMRWPPVPENHSFRLTGGHSYYDWLPYQKSQKVNKKQTRVKQQKISVAILVTASELPKNFILAILILFLFHPFLIL